MAISWQFDFQEFASYTLIDNDLFKAFPVGDIVDKNNPLGPSIIGCSDVTEPEREIYNKKKRLDWQKWYFLDL